MRKTISILLIVIFLPFISSVFAQEANSWDGVLHVKFKRTAIKSRPEKLAKASFQNEKAFTKLSKFGFKEAHKSFRKAVEDDTVGVDIYGNKCAQLDLSKWYTISFDTKLSLTELMDSLKQDENIESVSPVYKFSVCEPNDYYYMQGYQKGLKNPGGYSINATEAWNYNTGRSDVAIAVVDDGVDYRHVDLDPGNRSRIVQGYDSANDDNDPMEDGSSSHGTKVAGIIGAITNNSIGVAGIMQNVKIVPIKIFQGEGNSNDTWVGEGIIAAANFGAQIINISVAGPGDFGGIFTGNPIGDAVNNVYNRGVLIIAATGNNGSNTPYYPAAFPNVLAVGSVNSFGQRTAISNYGSHLDVMAPGENNENYSTIRNNAYGYFSGTSCAAPMVSGVAGLILSEARDRNISFTNDDIRHLIEATATDVNDPGWDEGYGYGLLNAGEALKILNSPYIVTSQTVYNYSGQMFWDTHEHVFYNNAGLASGRYTAKSYRVTGHVTFPSPFTAVPKLWLRDRETLGWSYANPNLELPYVKLLNVTATGFDYETVIYYVDAVIPTGQQIRKYYPGASSSLVARISYTAIGIPAPLSVSMSGPTSINNFTTGTWTANPSGGTAPYTYKWERRYDNVGPIEMSQPTGEYMVDGGAVINLPPVGYWDLLSYTTQSVSMYVSQSSPFSLRATVTDSKGATVQTIKSVTVTGVSAAKENAANLAEEASIMPEEFAISQNYPNPFNPNTSIRFDIKEGTHVLLKVYNSLGEEIETLVNEYKEAGRYTANFKAQDLPSGVYIYRISTGEFQFTRKMLFLK